MKPAAIYARVSSDRQKEENTIASQTTALKDFARSQGYEVMADLVFEDDGYSGATLIRPALERLRDLAAERQLETVLIYSPDRLSRKYAYQVLLVEELARHGVEIVFVKGPQSETPEDQLLLQFQGMIAEYERAQIAERTRRGKKHRAKAGEVSVLSCAPYGYRYIPRTTGAPARFDIIPDEARVVQMIFEKCTRDGLTTSAISRHLSTLGVPTRNGAAGWHPQVIWSILRNPAYKGMACFGRTQMAPRQRITRPGRLKGNAPPRRSSYKSVPPAEWIEIPVAPLVSEAIFLMADEQLKNNFRFSSRRTVEPGLVQGIASCKKCGYAYSIRSTMVKNKRHRYYRCCGSESWRQPGGRVCDSRAIRQELLDRVVWAEVVRLLEDPALITAELDRRLAAARAAEPAKRRQEQLEHDLAGVSKSIARLVTAYQEDLLSLEELKSRTPDLRRREQGIKAELQSLADQQATKATTLHLAETLSAFLSSLQSSAQTLDIHERQRVVRLLVKDVLIDDGAIIIRHSIPIQTPPPPPEDQGPFGDKSYSLYHRGQQADAGKRQGDDGTEIGGDEVEKSENGVHERSLHKKSRPKGGRGQKTIERQRQGLNTRCSCSH